jgi:FMN phosphatase YigB (HAD superfamily)
MSVRVVFFDFGGTLATDASGAPTRPSEVWVRVAHEQGIQGLDEATVERAIAAVDPVWGPRIYEYLGRNPEYWHLYQQAVMDQLDLPGSHQQFERGLDAIFNDPSRLRLFPEVRSTVQELRDRGFRLGVISNHHERILDQLRYLEVLPSLDTIVFSQEAGAEKPDARPFRLALERADCTPAEALHVGDSFEADYVGATRMGIRGVWLNRAGAPAPAPCEEVPDLRGLLSKLPSGPP